MKKNQAILVLISIFIVSAALGVGGTWGVKKLGDNSSVAVNDPIIIAGGGGSISSANSEEPTPTPVPAPKPSHKSTPKKEEPNPRDTETSGKKPLEVIVENETTQSPKPLGEDKDINMPTADITLVSVTGPTPNPETRTYSFTATASGGWGQYTYYLYPAKNARDTLVSTSGSFANVTPISSGKYILLIKDRTGKEFSQEIQGFKTILKRLTPQQLTTKLSNSSSVGSLKGYFSSSTKIDYIGSKSNGVKPAGYTEIPTFITAGVWERINVTNVEYNDYNRITAIVIKVY